MLASFFDRFKNKREEKDPHLIRTMCELSFLSSKHEPTCQAEFYNSSFSERVNDLYHNFHKRLSLLKESDVLVIADELSLLKQYISLLEHIRVVNFYVRYEEKIETNSIELPSLILFPIIQNALTHGYNSLEKYPVKIKVTVYAGQLQLEVSNRVNHHIESQENTDLLNHYKYRLDHYFSDRYSLLFNSNSNTFKATLHLRF